MSGQRITDAKASSSNETSKEETTTANNNVSNDDVTLVVTGDGKTKEEATKVALRSAIEQVYGTFVSANTSLVNDELTKDEIVTISSGNIKSYEEIESLSSDDYSIVTLKATVSISTLVSYAKSKGASVEFAGSTFGMNMKIKELNRKNEQVALDNLLDVITSFYQPYLTVNWCWMNRVYLMINLKVELVVLNILSRNFIDMQKETKLL